MNLPTPSLLTLLPLIVSLLICLCMPEAHCGLFIFSTAPVQIKESTAAQRFLAFQHPHVDTDILSGYRYKQIPAVLHRETPQDETDPTKVGRRADPA